MEHISTIVLGAGPAGLQIASFLERDGVDYRVFEQAGAPASFFRRYPLSGKLISINKKFTGTDDAEFNLRHDWNSLLTDKLPRFTELTDEYYPDRDTLVQYLEKFAEAHSLKIEYNSSAESVQRLQGGRYLVFVANEGGTAKGYTCDRLIVAIGMSVPNRPANITESVARAIRHYAEFPANYFTSGTFKEHFKNKSVCIIGNGNSGMELANLLTPVCSSVIVHGRSDRQLSSISHYTGDVRGVYLPFLDTFYLKSLNAMNVDTLDLKIEQATPSDKYKISYTGYDETVMHQEFLSISEFDEIIYCTGWKFNSSLFTFPIPMHPNGKYPLLLPNFQVKGMPGLYCIGAAGHGGDFRKSSGGFIHGFRYLIDEFYKLVYQKRLTEVEFPPGDIHAVVDKMIYSLNHTSGMYQMHGVLGDIFYFDPASKTIRYIHRTFSQYYQVILQSNPRVTCFVLTLEYGDKKTKEFRKLVRKQSSIGTEANAVLLHPVLRVVGASAKTMTFQILEELHLDEDTFTKFSSPRLYGDRLARCLAGFADRLS